MRLREGPDGQLNEDISTVGSVHQPQVSGPLSEASRGVHSCQEVASAFFLWLRGPGFPRLSHVSSVPAGKGRKETAPVWQPGLMGATRMGLAWLRSVGRAGFLGEAPGSLPVA